MNALLRLDEVMLKGNNQSDFVDQLLRNIRALFSGCRARRLSCGLFVQDISPDSLGELSLIPGVAKVAEAVLVQPDIAKIKNGLNELLRNAKTQSFRLTCSRSDKSFALNSLQIVRELGAFINEQYGWKVDLKNFELEIEIFIGREEAVLAMAATSGVGGLPTGSSGKVVSLLSGGIDSPVASYSLMKRGAEVVLVHFQNQTQVTAAVSEKIIDLAKTLARFQPQVELYIVPFADMQRQVIMHIPSTYRMLITRRVMLRIATQIARRIGAEALVTGDSLGQVASQTLSNLAAVYSATALLILSPLIGTTKREITDWARRIGTLAISERPYEDCCSLFVAKHPKTSVQTGHVEALETRLNVSVDQAVSTAYHTIITK